MKMNKRRVLIISTVGLIYDGITSVITSYLEAMDLSNLDVYVAETIKAESSIENRIMNLGCKIVNLPNRRTETLRYFMALQKFVRHNRIEVVHAHGNSATLAVDLLAAKLGGCKKRIAHSHNTKCDQVRADRMLRPLFYHLYTDALACGEEAGKWLFGNRPFMVLRNGRNVEKYKFNAIVRERMRKQYGFKDELVIGHVGGFVEQKNHAFLIEIFRDVLKIKSNAKLVLVGDGMLRKYIKESVSDISDSVLFIGTTDRVEDYLQMMDVMVLPSLFEGVPLVVIEWQINGLPCLISDTVTAGCKVTNHITFLSLSKTSKEWSETIININNNNKRKDNSIVDYEMVKDSIYNISYLAKELLRVYEE